METKTNTAALNARISRESAILSEPTRHGGGYTQATAGALQAIAWEPIDGGPTRADCYIKTGTPGCEDGRILSTVFNHENDRAAACREAHRRGLEVLAAG